MSNHERKMHSIGPGTLVTAAFIGPGTITTCIRIGMEDRYALLWAVVFTTISTIILHSTSARIGIITQKGLGENIRYLFKSNILRYAAVILVFLSIMVGNCAFETGNITGVIIGLQLLFPEVSIYWCSITICLFSLILICAMKFEKVQFFLSCCVFLMSAIFVALAIISRPNISEILNGVDSFSLGNGGLMNVLGLIGTTIGPYGLFLHSYAATKKWSKAEDIRNSNFDTILSISIGGIITASIIIVAAASIEPGSSIAVSYISDLTNSVINKWGTWTKYLFSVGLVLAGFSSCLTAPMGAAIATLGICGISADFSKFFVKTIASIVVLAGTVFSILFGSSPTQLILFAQVINAFILPLIACLLLFCANSDLMKEYKNTAIQNIESVFIIILCLLIGYRNLFNVFQLL